MGEDGETLARQATLEAAKMALGRADKKWQGLSLEEKSRAVEVAGNMVNELVPQVPDRLVAMGVSDEAANVGGISDIDFAKAVLSENGSWGGSPNAVEKFNKQTAMVTTWVEEVTTQIAKGRGEAVSKELVLNALVGLALSDRVLREGTEISEGHERTLDFARTVFSEAGKGVDDPDRDVSGLASGLTAFVEGVRDNNLEER
ncbi:hypothetical protein KKB40_02625, partial [Patescibacteria group bacterium]|nr:hypothetical protein [Patescibacteria group bacterium]